MGWQRLLLGCYSALFALVLPLICWGALAEPGHAHRYPHFVFADPVHARLPTGDASAVGLREWLWGQLRVEPHVQHHPIVENAADQKQASSVCDMYPADAIAGRATPTLMLFSILLLIFLSVRAMGRLDLPHFVLWQRPYFPASLLLPVPLPPPRLLLSSRPIPTYA